MLSRLALAFACLAAAIGIAACGDDDTVGGAREGDVQVAESGPVEGEFTVSSWPGYIDPGKDGSVAEFEERTGVSVSTSRTSTAMSSSSASCGRCWTRASPATAT